MRSLRTIRSAAPVALLAAAAALALHAAPAAAAPVATAPAIDAPADPPPPVTLQIGADRVLRTLPDGRAVVTGTVRCSGPDASVGGIEVRLTQRRGFLAVAGSAYLDAPVCDGEVRTWTAPVRGEAGVFGGGRGVVQVWAYVCGTGACANVVLKQDVRLARSVPR